MEFTSVLLPHHWWTVALRGLAAIVFGVLAFAWPAMTLSVLIVLFGAYALVDGVMTIISALRSAGDHHWGLLLEGVLDVAVGIAVFVWPAISALVLVYVIAAWAIATGALEVLSAIRLRNIIEREWAWIISGALSVVFGVMLVASPGAGALALVWVISLYAVLFGITMLVLSWRLRRFEHEHHEPSEAGGEGLRQPARP